MDAVLEKYELMKKLGIKSCVERINTNDDRVFWDIYPMGWSNHSVTPIAAAILERDCRVWLEEQGIHIDTVWEKGKVDSYEVMKQTPELENICCGGHCSENQSETCIAVGVKTHDTAQVEAMKYCLEQTKSEDEPGS